MNEILNHIAIIVCLVGLLIYLLAAKENRPAPRITEIGRLMFAFGLLAVLLGK